MFGFLSAVGEGFVHGAGAVALEVEGDVVEAEGLEGLNQILTSGIVHQQGEVAGVGFYASEGSMYADTEFAETEGAEMGFGLEDGGEHFAGDGLAIGEASGETGRRRKVPGGEFERFGYFTDHGLGETGFLEGGTDGEFGDGAHAGTEGVGVVGIGAFDDVLEAELAGEGEETGEEGLLADVATVGGVFGEAGEFGAGGLDDHVGDADEVGEATGVVDFVGGMEVAGGGDGKATVAEDVVGDFGEESGVDASGEGDEDGVEIAEDGAEPVEGLGDGWFGH